MHKLKQTIFTLILIFTFTYAFSEEVTSKNGMVVTAHPIASEFGLEILKSGGNAVDAAVGAAFVVGVVEPNASGLGGGGAMLVYLQKEDSLTYINYYACAPKQVASNFDRKKQGSSARAVLVPGTVAGLYHALKNYGTISWQDLLTRVIDKVKDGFPVNENFHKVALDSYEKLIKYPQTSATYLVNDLPPEPGEIIRNQRIVNTLNKLAHQGPDVFYRGELADSIEATMIKYGGTLRKSDLMDYRIRELSPLTGTYREYEIASAPPAQSGATVIEILNILEFKNLAAMGDYTQSPVSFHFMAEAMKRAYADRLQYLADPKFFDVPTETLISKKFARHRFDSINMEQPIPLKAKDVLPGDVSPYVPGTKQDDPHGSTTQISVIDAAGNAVSLTQTLNHFWGSGITVCGFLLNNGMTTFMAGAPNKQIFSGQQPLTTISPSILFKNDRVGMVIGSPGAGRIMSTIVEVICNVVDFNKGAEQANLAPRFYSPKWTEILPVEARFSEDLIEKLKAMGHPIQTFGEMDMYFGGVQLIVVDQENKILIGSSDPRRAGMALGY